MQRIRRAKVLLSGLRGLGAEVAKNLVLMGVGSLTLHDSQPACWSDLAAQVSVLAGWAAMDSLANGKGAQRNLTQISLGLSLVLPLREGLGEEQG